MWGQRSISARILISHIACREKPGAESNGLKISSNTLLSQGITCFSTRFRETSKGAGTVVCTIRFMKPGVCYTLGWPRVGGACL
jgi:hypothetical protein